MPIVETGGSDCSRSSRSPWSTSSCFVTGSRPASADGLGVVKTTLEKMARGGIFDQIGGGFHRYSTDSVWLAPHFEKMLYDNASAGGVVPPRLASDWRTAVPAGRREDAGLRAEGDDPSSQAASIRRRMPTLKAKRANSSFGCRGRSIRYLSRTSAALPWSIGV